MDLIYGIKDKPKFGKVVLFALQQLLAIMAATIAVPAIIGHGLTASAALFGAGVGTSFVHKKLKPSFSWKLICFHWFNVLCLCRSRNSRIK